MLLPSSSFLLGELTLSPLLSSSFLDASVVPEAMASKVGIVQHNIVFLEGKLAENYQTLK